METQPNEVYESATFDLKKFIKSLNQRPVAYYPIYRDLMGSVAGGVLLSQLMFWYGAAEGDEFSKSDAELKQQTGLSAWEFKTEKTNLKSLSFLEIKARGVPATTNYKIDSEKFAKTLSSLETVLQTEKNNNLRKSPVCRTSYKLVGRPSSKLVGRTVSKLSFIEKKERIKERLSPPIGATQESLTDKKPKPSKYKYEDRDMAAAKWMYGELQNQNPNFKKPNFDAWAQEIRLMREKDNRDYKQIADLWIWTRTDSFWMSNVLSPAKLREKWDQLWMKMTAPKNGKPNGHAVGAPRQISYEPKTSWESPQALTDILKQAALA